MTWLMRVHWPLATLPTVLVKINLKNYLGVGALALL